MGGGGGRPASGSLVHSMDLGRAPEEMVVVRGQEGMQAPKSYAQSHVHTHMLHHMVSHLIGHMTHHVIHYMIS